MYLIESCEHQSVKRRCLEKYEQGSSETRMEAIREAVLCQARMEEEKKKQKELKATEDWTVWLTKTTPDFSSLGRHFAQFTKFDYKRDIVYKPKGGVVDSEWVSDAELSFWDHIPRTLPMTSFNLSLNVPECETVFDAVTCMAGIQAVAWHAMHDVFFRERTPEWLRTVMSDAEKLVKFAVRLQEDVHSIRTINSKVYRTEFDYHRVKQVWVNARFMQEVETFCTEMWLMYRKSEGLQPIPEVPLPDLTAFSKTIQEEELVETRRIHYDDLMYTPLLQRWMDIRKPGSRTTAAREALSSLGFEYIQACKTAQQVLDPATHIGPEAKKRGEPLWVHELISKDAVLRIYSRASITRDVIASLKVWYNPLLQVWVWNKYTSPSLLGIYAYLVSIKVVEAIEVEV
jgi:hypothetical protein